MATPPAEAPSLAKEEKPQLPPSPNGVSSPNNASGYVFLPLPRWVLLGHCLHSQLGRIH